MRWRVAVSKVSVQVGWEVWLAKTVPQSGKGGRGRVFEGWGRQAVGNGDSWQRCLVSDR